MQSLFMLCLSEQTAKAFLAFKKPDESSDDAIDRLFKNHEPKKKTQTLMPVHMPLIETMSSVNEVAAADYNNSKVRDKLHAVGSHTLTMLGKKSTHLHKLDVLVEFMKVAIDLAPDCIDLLLAIKFRTRRVLARTRAELYAGRPDLKAVEISPNLWIPTNVGGADIKRITRRVSEVLGLKMDSDVVVTFA